MSRKPTTWPNAAQALSRRVARRERVGALLVPLGRALLGAGAVALAMRLLGIATPWPEVLLGAGLALGLGIGAWRASRVEIVRPAYAAWALDRIAGADERGLVAATVPGAAGAEAAWAQGRIEPPPIRLLPPPGFATALGGLLAVALALIVPPPAGAEARPGTGDALQAEAPAPGAAGASAGPAADAQAARARAAASVREALGLGAQEAADPETVAGRLALEPAREAAGEAAPAGSELAGLLANGASAADIADAMAAGAKAEAKARGARRQAAAQRAREGVLSIPPDRRAVVERYFWLLGEAEGNDSGER